MFKVKVIAKLHPTEDYRMVSVALKTVLDGKVHTEKVGENTYLYIESDDYNSLEKFYEQVRKQKILDVARKELRHGIAGSSTVFFLNKQVACTGKLNFCPEIGESPLGPIRVELEYDDIEILIDWLTPYTKRGKEVTLVQSFP